MSLNRGRKMKKLITALVICGSFLFLLTVRNAFAANNYNKVFNDTLTSSEWNNLKQDFVNTWETVSMNGPLSIGTTTLATTPIFLNVDGGVQANFFTGRAQGLLLNPYGGNVGIGTTNPAYKLDVVGNAQFSVGDNAVRFVKSGAGYTGIYYNRIYNSEGFNLTYWNGTSEISGIRLVGPSGNVGIGTSTPTQKLHVAGEAQFDAVVWGVTPGQSQSLALATVAYVNSMSGGTGGVGVGTSGQTLRHDGTGWVANSNLFNTGTNVGIGTTALNGAKFKISLSNILAIDFFNNQEKIATISGGTINSGKLQVAPSACGPGFNFTGPDGLSYGTVQGPDGKCWLDRNLGATQVATAINDTLAYGNLYQWGRGVDGHQITTSGTTDTLSSSDQPGHSNFIKSPLTPYDWRSPQNNNLWQGYGGVNNPCPTGFRLPTQPEWAALVSAAGITNGPTAYASALKLPYAGYRGYSNAGLIGQGSGGYYWSSTPNGIYAYNLYFNSTAVGPANNNIRAYGFSVRCLKD